MSDKGYPVVETFYSFQGEGQFIGRAAFFVRLYGCDQKCHFCDSAVTWHPDYKPSNVPFLSPREILKRARDSYIQPGAFLVLTGGEPALYNLNPLIFESWEEGFPVHIETAGHRALPDAINWITLSPKLFATPPLKENIQRANEFKIIVEDEESLCAALSVILPDCRETAPIWLHPEWSRRHDAKILDLITLSVKVNPRLRAGYQLHKLYKADLLDPQSSKVTVPLGGEANGGSSQ